MPRWFNCSDNADGLIRGWPLAFITLAPLSSLDGLASAGPGLESLLSGCCCALQAMPDSDKFGVGGAEPRGVLTCGGLPPMTLAAGGLDPPMAMADSDKFGVGGAEPIGVLTCGGHPPDLAVDGLSTGLIVTSCIACVCDCSGSTGNGSAILTDLPLPDHLVPLLTAGVTLGGSVG